MPDRGQACAVDASSAAIKSRVNSKKSIQDKRRHIQQHVQGSTKAIKALNNQQHAIKETTKNSRTLSRFLSNGKGPEKGSGAAGVPSFGRTFQFFYQDPLAFCSIKQEARGLHSLRTSSFLYQKR
jgi:hypothetical protein